MDERGMMETNDDADRGGFFLDALHQLSDLVKNNWIKWEGNAQSLNRLLENVDRDPMNVMTHLSEWFAETPEGRGAKQLKDWFTQTMDVSSGKEEDWWGYDDIDPENPPDDTGHYPEPTDGPPPSDPYDWEENDDDWWKFDARDPEDPPGDPDYKPEHETYETREALRRLREQRRRIEAEEEALRNSRDDIPY